MQVIVPFNSLKNDNCNSPLSIFQSALSSAPRLNRRSLAFAAEFVNLKHILMTGKMPLVGYG